MKSKKILIISASIFITLLFVSFTVYSFVQEVKREQIPVLGQVNPFSLTTTEGKNFGLKELTDKVWIADFFFTTCADICPVMTKNMTKLYKTFEHVAGVELVSISVNPEYDNVEVMKAYAQKHRKEDGKWHFLTGEREDIRDVVINSFKLGSIEKPIFHSSYFSLVDRHGLIRGYYDGTNTQALNKLFKDAAQLAKER